MTYWIAALALYWVGCGVSGCWVRAYLNGELKLWEVVVYMSGSGFMLPMVLVCDGGVRLMRGFMTIIIWRKKPPSDRRHTDKPSANPIIPNIEPRDQLYWKRRNPAIDRTSCGMKDNV